MQHRLLLAGFVFGAASTLAGGAEAFYRRLPAATCFDGHGAFDETMTNRSTSQQNQPMNCPLIETESVAKSQVTFINVHAVHPSGAPVYAWACVDYWDASGAACGSWVSASGTGGVVLHPPTTTWTSAYALDFAYVYTTLPSGSTLRGVYLGG